MTKPHVDYDQLAATYNRRFAAGENQGVASALLAQVESSHAASALEIGCGTGHWLAHLYPSVHTCCGLDLSGGMLSQARHCAGIQRLVQGYASAQPFKDATFDFVYCVNAIHHFGKPASFIQEAFRVLRPGGRLAVIGSDPHSQEETWYLYHYFEGTYETDMARFPRWETVREWVAAAGFKAPTLQEVERIQDIRQGWEILSDPFLKKESCSQLALLSDAAYAAGVRRIEEAIAKAEARGEPISFKSEILLKMLVARKPD